MLVPFLVGDVFGMIEFVFGSFAFFATDFSILSWRSWVLSDSSDKEVLSEVLEDESEGDEDESEEMAEDVEEMLTVLFSFSLPSFFFVALLCLGFFADDSDALLERSSKVITSCPSVSMLSLSMSIICLFFPFSVNNKS